MEIGRIILTWLSLIYICVIIYPYVANFWKWVFHV